MSGLYMFVGDSHARQFQMDVSGQVSFTSISGATLKGLAAEGGRTGHHRTVMDLAAVRRWKTLFVMFGGVDFDATWFRKLTLEGSVDEATFFADRIAALDTFLTKLLAANTVRVLSRVCVLLPQATGLRDSHFLDATVKMAKVERDDLSRAVAAHDTGLASRCRRVIAFNDQVEAELPRHDRTTLHRTDRRMVDADGLLLDTFLPKDPRDHHPRKESTLPLWWDALQDVMPAFKKHHLRRVATAAKRARSPVDA